MVVAEPRHVIDAPPARMGEGVPDDVGQRTRRRPGTNIGDVGTIEAIAIGASGSAARNGSRRSGSTAAGWLNVRGTRRA